MPEVFSLQQGPAPVLISSPHDGDLFPTGLTARLAPAGLDNADRDWHVTRLYPFIEELGLSLLRANYSRYVVDLNRPTDGEALYPGKTETGICPLYSFVGQPLYHEGDAPSDNEVQERIELYWKPYHAAIRNELDRIQSKHGYAVLWDAHSIRAEVPALFEGVLPGLSFGTNDGRSCDTSIVTRLVDYAKEHAAYSVILNGRFKGGYITRHYGDPTNQVQAIQLEINQSTYLDGQEVNDEKASQLSTLLHALLSILAKPEN